MPRQKYYGKNGHVVYLDPDIVKIIIREHKRPYESWNGLMSRVFQISREALETERRKRFPIRDEKELVDIGNGGNQCSILSSGMDG